MTAADSIHAVITNDDGIGSEGLRMLARAAVRAGWDVAVAAPDRQASGSGAAMTAVQAGGQVIIERHQLPGIETVPAYAVQAAPGFIAFTAVRGAFGRRPDYLLSGHSHVAADRREGGTRRINPGALHEAEAYSVALLDLGADELRFITVPR